MLLAVSLAFGQLPAAFAATGNDNNGAGKALGQVKNKSTDKAKHNGKGKDALDSLADDAASAVGRQKPSDEEGGESDADSSESEEPNKGNANEKPDKGNNEAPAPAATTDNAAKDESGKDDAAKNKPGKDAKADDDSGHRDDPSAPAPTLASDSLPNDVTTEVESLNDNKPATLSLLNDGKSNSVGDDTSSKNDSQANNTVAKDNSKSKDTKPAHSSNDNSPAQKETSTPGGYRNGNGPAKSETSANDTSAAGNSSPSNTPPAGKPSNVAAEPLVTVSEPSTHSNSGKNDVLSPPGRATTSVTKNQPAPVVSPPSRNEKLTEAANAAADDMWGWSVKETSTPEARPTTPVVTPPVREQTLTEAANAVADDMWSWSASEITTVSKPAPVESARAATVSSTIAEVATRLSATSGFDAALFGGVDMDSLDMDSQDEPTPDAAEQAPLATIVQVDHGEGRTVTETGELMPEVSRIVSKIEETGGFAPDTFLGLDFAALFATRKAAD